MLFRKKEEEPRVCAECGCLVAHWRAKKVIQEILRDNYDTAFTCFNEPEPLFYCGRCAPPYDQICTPSDGGNHRYFARVPGCYEEVTEEGKPIKKK